MKNSDFAGLNVLVTGGTRGLGLSLIHALQQRGAEKIYAGCRTQQGCEHIAGLNLPQVEPLLLDVAKTDQFGAIKNSISKLDLLINNAGVASMGGYLSADARTAAVLEMETHYFGPLALVHELLPILKQSAQSGIINISSIAGISNFKLMGTYSASKAALHFMTQGMRAELNTHGIFVQGVYPGPFDTRLSEGFNGPKPSPDEIAALVLDAYAEKISDVFPDEFSKSMHEIFQESPKKLESIFAEFGA